MADIAKITLPSGNTYDLKDQGARDLIASLQSYSSFLGVTTTALSDGATTSSITVNGTAVTAANGAIATYGNKEFIFNGTSWQEFGDMSALGDLAYKNSASGSVTAKGTVSKPTFTGTQGTFTPAGTISINSITPKGSVTSSFSGSSGTVSTTGTATIVATTPLSGAVNTYTPSGTVAAPKITLNTSGNTQSMYSITGVGSLPSCTLPVFSTSVSDETLTFSWTTGSFSAGSLPTRSSAYTVLKSGVTATADAPAFTGTAVELAGTVSASGSFTPSGTVTSSFSGTSVTPTGSFTGTQGNFTPAGTVSQPTFTGSSVTVTVE